jgi:disease resistance protein RPM1
VDFDAAAWVTVSKSYRVEDLLKKIATEFGMPINSSIVDTRRLVEVAYCPANPQHTPNGKVCMRS